MHKPPIATEKSTIQLNKEPNPPSLSSAYAESVRMTSERLFKAVKKNYRQGGLEGAQDE